MGELLKNHSHLVCASVSHATAPFQFCTFPPEHLSPPVLPILSSSLYLFADSYFLWLFFCPVTVLPCHSEATAQCYHAGFPEAKLGLSMSVLDNWCWQVTWVTAEPKPSTSASWLKRIAQPWQRRSIALGCSLLCEHSINLLWTSSYEQGRNNYSLPSPRREVLKDLMMSPWNTGCKMIHSGGVQYWGTFSLGILLFQLHPQLMSYVPFVIVGGGMW